MFLPASLKQTGLLTNGYLKVPFRIHFNVTSDGRRQQGLSGSVELRMSSGLYKCLCVSEGKASLIFSIVSHHVKVWCISFTSSQQWY